MEAEGSLSKSNFQFVSFKVNRINLESEKSLQLLNFSSSFPSDMWLFEISLGDPQYFKKNKTYVVQLFMKAIAEQSKDEGGVQTKKNLVKIEGEIAGSFKVNEQFSSELEENLVKFHAPTLLLPYMRTAFTSTLSSSGFGTVIFPLVNLHEMAKTSFQGLKVQIIE